MTQIVKLLGDPDSILVHGQELDAYYTGLGLEIETSFRDGRVFSITKLNMQVDAAPVELPALWVTTKPALTGTRPSKTN